MDTMYGFARDMIRARLSTLCDAEPDSSEKKEPTETETAPLA